MSEDIQFNFIYNTENNNKKEQILSNEKFYELINEKINRFVKLEIPIKLFKYYDDEILKLIKLGFVSFNFQFHKDVLSDKSIEFLKYYCKYRDLDIIYDYYYKDGSKGNFMKYDFIRAIVTLKKLK